MPRLPYRWKLALAGSVPCAAAAAFAPWIEPTLAGLLLPTSAGVVTAALLLRVAGRAEVEARLQAERVEEANRHLQQRVRQLSLLSDITRSLTATLESGELLRRLAELVGRGLGYSEFAILLLDPARQELVVGATWGVGLAEGARLPLDEEPRAEAARSGEAVVLGSVTRHGGEAAAGRGSLLALPMKHKNAVVGVIQIARPEVDGFSGEELEFLGSVAGQAALAISNARLYEETVALSITDPLTGVHNRRHLFSRLEAELCRGRRYGQEVTVMMIDIDHFKILNDTKGHVAGDAVLRQVARLLAGSVRRVDTVARFGGEEFCLVFPCLRKADARDVAEKLRLAVQRAALPHAPELGAVTVSVGCATFPDDGADVGTVLDAADRALYVSKRTGRNRSTVFEEGMEVTPGPQPAAAVAAGRLAARASH